MNLSDDQLQFILDFEGWRPYLYDDGSLPGHRGRGNATVAVGALVHLGPYHDRGVCAECDKWPRDTDPQDQWLPDGQAFVFLAEKATGTGHFAGETDYLGAVDGYFPNVNANRRTALLDFAFNLGPGYLHIVAAIFNSGGDVCAELVKYCKYPPQFHDQLLARRQAECTLFNTPEEDEMTPQQIQQLNDASAGLIRLQVDVDELANGIDAVSVANKWPLSLKGLWFVAQKRWPF